MKIVVDTNIVFSALLNSNSRIGRLLLDTRNHFEFYSCKYLQKELFRCLPKIRKYSRLKRKGYTRIVTTLELNALLEK
jgi:predicted nucleic acid-binding protein